MNFSYDFQPLELTDLRREAAFMKADKWRFVQMLAANNEVSGVDLYYSFMKEGDLRNYCIEAVSKQTEVPSITDLFLAAFVFENEARELFGVNMGPIAIDFSGGMYAPAEDEPMTFISPERKAALDKLKKASAAAFEKAKESKDERVEGVIETIPDAQGKPKSRALRHDQVAKIKEVMPTLSEELAAKLQAVLDRSEVALEEQNTAQKVEGFTPNAVVGDKPVVCASHEVDALPEEMNDEPIALFESDEELDALLSIMDEKRSAIVLEALKKGRA